MRRHVSARQSHCIPAADSGKLVPVTERWRGRWRDMPVSLKPNQALDLWRRTLVDTVRRDSPDLSARQMALLLTVYLTAPPHTVRGLAATLDISKPAITRALDRLGELGFIRRKTDDDDKRNVLVQRTVKGSVYLTDFAQLVVAAGEQAAGEQAE